MQVSNYQFHKLRFKIWAERQNTVLHENVSMHTPLQFLPRMATRARSRSRAVPHDAFIAGQTQVIVFSLSRTQADN
jgi:hypothetical protein